MLHLNSSVHFHEEMLVPIDYALECGDRIQANRLTKFGSLRFHSVQSHHILAKDPRFLIGPGVTRSRFCRQQRFTCNRDF